MSHKEKKEHRDSLTGKDRKLKKLREKKKMSIEELSEKTGIKASHLNDIEDGKHFVPVGDLLKIARALTVKPEILLKEENDSEIDLKKRRVDAFKKRENEYNYKVLTPEAVDKHLRAFNVSIPPESEHPKVSYQHEGEEFIYVLHGELILQVGQKIQRLFKGDSYHFNSGLRHRLKNPGKKETVLLVTVYTP